MSRYSPFLVLTFFFLNLGRGAWVQEANSFALRRLVWTKIATICMRRDVAVMYRVKYNSDRGCCPKLLLYSDQQYQRIVFLKALDILKEDEIARRTGRRETEIRMPSPGRRRRSSTSLRSGREKRHRLIHSKRKSTSNFENDVLNQRCTLKVGPREALKHVTQSDEYRRERRGFPPKKDRRKRSLGLSGTNITYAEVIEKLYFGKKTLFEKAERRVRHVDTCTEAKETLTRVLDPTQIISLCPNSGISIDHKLKAYKICGDTIRPSKQVFLPNLTETQSWFGYSENSGGNPEQSTWKANTWHLALFNCPGAPPLNITYVIDFDVIRNLGKVTSDPGYENANLERECQRTVLPLYAEQDGIPRGGSATAHVTPTFLILIEISLLSLVPKS